MLEVDLLKTKKCVTPSGPATATKSFIEFFFRTCSGGKGQTPEILPREAPGEPGNRGRIRPRAHLEGPGGVRLHHLAHVQDQLAHVLAHAATVEDEGVGDGAEVLLRLLHRRRPFLLLVLGLGGQLVRTGKGQEGGCSPPWDPQSLLCPPREGRSPRSGGAVLRGVPGSGFPVL